MGVRHVHISAQRKYNVRLSDKDKQLLKTLTHKGVAKARIITRARILLLADQQKTDATICASLGLVRSVVYDTRKHYVTGGLKRALYDLPRPGQARKLTGSQEAEVVAIACSDAPKGYTRWTLDLLTEEVKNKLGVFIGRTAIWKVLLRNNTKPWLKKNVVYSQGNS
jgi:transposase